MQIRANLVLLVGMTLAAGTMAQAWSQSLTHDPMRVTQQPSQQQIEGFCANWGQ